MNVVITGGCGFIGTNLINRLLQNRSEYKIRIFDNLSTGTKDYVSSFAEIELLDDNIDLHAWGVKKKSVEIIKGDIRDFEAVKKAFTGADKVIHLAANTGVPNSVENPVMDCNINVLGTLNCLEAARINNVKRFVFASSGAPVGDCEPPIHEELPSHPKSPYGASKLSGEGYCSAYAHVFNLSTVVLRFSNVYGPFSDKKSSVVAKFIRSALEHQPLTVFGSGNQTRDYIFVEDLVEAIISALLDDEIKHDVFQIATNSETTVNELITILVRAFNEFNISSPSIFKEEERLGDIERNYSDISKAKRILHWIPVVSLQEGVKRTIRWFLEEWNRADV